MMEVLLCKIGVGNDRDSRVELPVLTTHLYFMHEQILSSTFMHEAEHHTADTRVS
jgi:hypothetical protein